MCHQEIGRFLDIDQSDCVVQTIQVKYLSGFFAVFPITHVDVDPVLDLEVVLKSSLRPSSTSLTIAPAFDDVVSQSVDSLVGVALFVLGSVASVP